MKGASAMPSDFLPTVGRYRVSFLNTHTNQRRRVYFGREIDAKEYFVRLVTNPRIAYVELARIGRKGMVLGIVASHYADDSPEGGAA